MISIITGTLNRVSLLNDMVNNCLSHTLNELILVDGGSTDGTQKYIQQLNNPNIQLIEIGKRTNWSSFMNLGLKQAKGDLICQWNDDVLLLSDWDNVVSQITSNYDIYIFSWKTGKKQERNNKQWLETGSWSNDGISTNNWRCSNHCLNYGIYKKHVFDTIGTYDESFSFYHADSEITARAKYFGFKLKLLTDIKVIDLDFPNKTKANHAKEKQDYNNYLTCMGRYAQKG